MWDYIAKTFAPRVAQDLVTALVGLLAAHGWVTSDQTQSLIGSLFFIVMLIVNRLIGDARTTKAQVAGGMAVAAQADNIPTSPGVVKAIIAQAKVTK